MVKRQITATMNHLILALFICSVPNVQDNRARGPTELDLEKPKTGAEANDVEEPISERAPVHRFAIHHFRSTDSLSLFANAQIFRSSFAVDSHPNS